MRAHRRVTHQPRPTVLVGVSASAASAAAVRWAATEAARRGARLHAVHVVDLVDRYDAGLGADPHLELADAQRSVPARVAGWVFTAGLEADLVVSVTDGPTHGSLPATLAAQCLPPVAVVSVDDHAYVVDEPNRHQSTGASHVRT
jgi:nucleotide-binding universal stress UspA family protein